MANKIVTVQDLLDLVPSGFDYSTPGMTTTQCPTKSEIEQYGQDNYTVNSTRQNNQLVTSPDVSVAEKNVTYTFKCNYTVNTSPGGLTNSYGLTLANIQIKLVNKDNNNVVYANADNIVLTELPTGMSVSRTGTINAQFQAPADGQYRVADVNVQNKDTNVSVSISITGAQGYIDMQDDDEWELLGAPWQASPTTTVITETSNSTIDLTFRIYPMLESDPQFKAYPITFEATGAFITGGKYKMQGDAVYRYKCAFSSSIRMTNGAEFGDYCISSGNKETFDWNLYLPANSGNRCKMVITTPTTPSGLLYFFKLTLPSVINMQSIQYHNQAQDDHDILLRPDRDGQDLICIFPQSSGTTSSYDQPVNESEDYRVSFEINDPDGTIVPEYLDIIFTTSRQNWIDTW